MVYHSFELFVKTLTRRLRNEFFGFVYWDPLHPNIGNNIWVDDIPHHPAYKMCMRVKPGSDLGLDIWVSDDGFMEVFLRRAVGGEILEAFAIGDDTDERVERIVEKYFFQKNGSAEQHRLVEQFWAGSSC